MAFATGLGSIAMVQNAAAQAGRSIMVLELFTSQGCNSCPPADALMFDWAKQPDVLPLSLHVDYWDYLGWKDTFGKKGHSKRQHEYAQSMGKRQIYTPQVVVDGRFQAVGSDQNAVAQALNKARKSERVTLQAEFSKGAWQILVPDVAGWQGEAKVLLCRYDRRHDVTIERGENHGKTITYLNVARAWNTFGEWKGQAATYRLPDLGEIDWSTEGVVVMLQSHNGPILGAVDIQGAN
ncbi:DUF1223 domain-containing protein [uncultured Ferrovibrio sp.]|jgi:Uncharacterized secreted protein|uniref:DUF1223 domain-containing protein n=1 Tax=uncultured Ferrovibrio sp. TaxID=1576913 RepID=UPI00262EBECB|nr:DUF1223 domain-containing protein [uncultured Ferrovibrio sp.]